MITRSNLSRIIPVLLPAVLAIAGPAWSLDWMKTYHGQYLDQGLECAADNAGGLYVVGGSATVANMTNFNWIIIKYNAATGDTVWTRRISSASTGTTIAMGCAADNSGHLFVTGTRATATGSEALTIKFNSTTGDTMWTRPFPGAGALDCRLDGSGNLYVTGITGSGAASDYVGMTNAFDEAAILVADYGAVATGVRPRRTTFRAAPFSVEKVSSGGYAVNFSLPADGRLKLAVFDRLGRLQGMIAEKNCPAGVNTAVWKAGRLAPGAYLCCLSINNRVERTLRVMVSR